MIGASVFIDTRARRELEREFSRQLEKSAIAFTLRAAKTVKEKIRSEMATAGLGTLGMGIGHGHGGPEEKAGNVRRKGAGWSASGAVFIREGSRRTRGAIASYTDLPSTQIRPKNGRWLWIATPDLKRVVGLPKDGKGGPSKARLTPALWDLTYGLKFGSLQVIKGINGRPLLILSNPAGVSLSGKRGIRTLRKNGQPRRGDIAKKFIVAFIAIPATSRAAKINVPNIINQVISDLARQDGLRFEGV